MKQKDGQSGYLNQRVGLSVLAVLLTAAALVSQSINLALASLDLDARFVDADLIRVGISDDAMNAWEYPSTQVSATGPFTVKDKATGMLLLNGKPGEVVTVTVDRLGFFLRSNLLSAKAPVSGKAPVPGQSSAKPASKVPLPSAVDLTLSKVSPTDVVNALVRVPGPLVVEPQSVNDRVKILNITRRKENPSFRGFFEIARASSSPSKLTVVNVVSLEDYLKAVVPNELPMRYGLEAVRAQAIAARNYAIRPREKPWKTFDICDSQLCQVYLGAQTETPDSNRAIADTEGLVGLYDGEPILALFSSSHGGFAENYSYAFSDPKTKQYPAPPIAYLQGGPDVPMDGPDLRTEAGARKFWTNPDVQSFDVESPYYRWKKQWTRPELEAAINKGLREVSKESGTKDFVSPLFKANDTIGTLRTVNVLERGISGKAMVLNVVGSRGTWTVKKEFLIRKLFTKGGRMLPSGNVVFTPLKDANGALSGMIAQGGGFGHGVGLSQLGASWMHKHGYRFPQIIQHYYKGVSLGSRPVSVGANRPDLPVLTRFDAQRAKGTLWVQEGERGLVTQYNRDPVRIRLNGRELTVSPSGYLSGTDVDGYLRSGDLNTLVLYPDARHPERKLKAWVELYPPTRNAVAQR
jgi:SpoIID/LytB domain protein